MRTHNLTITSGDISSGYLGEINNIPYNSVEEIKVYITVENMTELSVRTSNAPGWMDPVWEPNSEYVPGRSEWWVLFRPTVNTSTSKRSATITFINDDKGNEATFTITQAENPASLTVEPTSIIDNSGMGFGETGKDIIVNASGAGETVSYSKTADWIQIKKKNANTYTVTLTKNEGSAKRTATITFTYGGLARSVSVEQAVAPEAEFLLDNNPLPAEHNIEGPAGRMSINVTGSRSDWSIRTTTESNRTNWLNINSCTTGGNTTGQKETDYSWIIENKLTEFTIDLSYGENNTGSNREAFLYVTQTAYGQEYKFKIIQKPAAYKKFLEESDDAVSFDNYVAAEKSITLYVTGDADLKVTIPNYNEAMHSNDWLDVSNLGKNNRVEVPTKNCYKYTPIIKALSDNDDLHAEERLAVITFTYGEQNGEDVTHNVSVRQPIKNWTGVEFTPTNSAESPAVIPAEGGTDYSFTVTSDRFTTGEGAGKWIYECDSNWITIDPPSDLGKRTVTFKYSVNSNIGNGDILVGPERTCQIKLTDTSGWFNIFYVKQKAGNGIAVEAEELDFTADDNGSKTATVYVAPSNASYEVKALNPAGSAAIDWAHPTKDGNKVTITVDPNTTTDTRTGRIVFTSGKASVSKDITQVGKKVYSFSVDPSDHTFQKSENSEWFDLEFTGTNIEMTPENVSIKSKPDWITAEGIGSSNPRFELTASANTGVTLGANKTEVSVASTAGTTTIPLTYSANSKRSGLVELVYGNNLATATIEVSQEGDSDTASGSPTIGTIEGTWISAVISEADLNITVESNGNTSERSGSVQVNYYDKSITITVKQAGTDGPDGSDPEGSDPIYLEKATLNSDGYDKGDESYHTLNSDTSAADINITAISIPDWVRWRYDNSFGLYIVIYANENAGGVREGTAEFKGDGGEIYIIEITQEGGYTGPLYSISVNPNELNFLAAGEEKPVTITTTGNARLSIRPPEWIEYRATNNNDNTWTLAFTAAENTGEARNDTITLRYGGNKTNGTANITFNQEGSGTPPPPPSTTMTANPSRLVFSWEGGKLTSTITIN